MPFSLHSDRVSGRSGHSGGPVLNSYGEVIGWAVKSCDDLGPNGQLRPVEQLEAAVGKVLDQLVPARPSKSNVRHRLQGQLRAGTYCMGEVVMAVVDAEVSRLGTPTSGLRLEMGLRKLGAPPTAAVVDDRGSPNHHDEVCLPA